MSEELLAALILAGGKSGRMGMPKALLDYAGDTFLGRITRVVDECESLGPCVVVAGAHFEEIARAAGSQRVVHNADHAAGMLTSFQTGIRALPGEVDGVLVFLVDHPVVSISTVRALVDRAGTADIVVPVYEGRRGHPVLFSRRVMDEIQHLPAGTGVDSLVRRDPERVAEVPVTDRGVLIDVDTPEDFERLRAGWR